ncbi:DNA repair protein REV1 [Nasonia vitripennis]|uniref:DNA repair protein REV1 n=1 Tax=Nasonia vitripennis TaxID=7425 RepID=A0A7M7GF39_NASVI|nr:DNA repair protein REV1 [Nasonia vitripennis]
MAEKKKNAAWADCCEDWGGYMAAKKAKLEEQFQEAAQSEFSNASTLFNGIAIFVNGYTNPTADELKRLMMAHGGIYHHYLRSQTTTHMIASNLPYSKIVAYRKAKNPLPLCKPEWITDSIKAGKVLDFRNYLLYSQCTKTQPSIFAQMTKQNKSSEASRPESASDILSNATKSNVAVDSKSEVKVAEKMSEPKVQTSSSSEAPSVIANCTKNPEFLTDFYNNSRLHHIATMGAMFKEYINDLRDKSDGKFPGLDALKHQSYVNNCKAGPSNKVDDSDSDEDLFATDESPAMNLNISSSAQKSQIIMHIDMDCFFVSVGLRNHPELRGFPIAVAHAKGNKQNDPSEYGSMSEVASCSYEARKAGVKNGMLLGKALKLCPNLKTIRYDFDGYKEVSYTLYDTLASYTLDIEAVSCDEMYADCTKILKVSGLTPLEFATIIRNEIKKKTGCPVSTGFGENKLQARLATKKAKPDGQCYLKGDSIRSFIRTLKVRDLPGVGWSTSEKLQKMNVETCADLETISLYELQKEFGKKNGQQLHDMCRGIDQAKLNLEHVRKSVSAEVNYGIRFENAEAAHEFLKKLSMKISDRLKKINSKGKCITLKVMFRAKEAPNEPLKFMGHGLCDAYNKSKNLIAPTDDSVIITREAIALWNQFSESPQDARGIGIQITKLESLKSKTAGSTILKFIDRMKAPVKKLSETDCLTSSDTREQQNNHKEMSVPNTNTNNEISVHNNKLDTNNENEITLSLENQLLSEDIKIDCHQSNTVPKSDSSEKNANDNPFKVTHMNETPSSSKNKLVSTQINVGASNATNLPKKDTSLISSSQSKQKTQPDYFKQTKPFSANRSAKIKVPDIQEIDMNVLVELPEDIRNEILNEYKQNKNNEKPSTSPMHKTQKDNSHNKNTISINNRLEENLSFSQIDPEFLAALPEEMKNEVKSYCNAKKNVKKVTPTNNIVNKAWGMFKTEKQPQKSTKSKAGKLKVTKGAGKKETKSNASSTNDKKVNEKGVTSNNNKMQEINQNPQAEEPPGISAARRSFHFDPANGNEEHSEILSSLVNCLLDLPIIQVKLQMQQWIVNNSDVNDVDFLSLTTYLGTLPRKGRLLDLHCLLNCLHRCVVKSESCIWHSTYEKMLKHIQARVRQYCGYNIWTKKIDCDKCKTNEV